MRLEPRTGVGFVLEKGRELAIVDVEGEQVADLYAVAHDDPGEWLSNGRTFDYGGKLQLSTDDVLYSNRSRPMLTIVADSVGAHNFLYAPCSREMFRIQYGTAGERNCLDNLAAALAPYGVTADAITIPFNAFMNVEVHPDGRLEVLPPRSRAGDSLRVRAEMDLAVAVSACSALTCNNGRCKPIELELP